MLVERALVYTLRQLYISCVASPDFLRLAVLLRCFIPTLIMACSAAAMAEDWKVTTHGTMFYTDDVAIFSATRRLTLDGDPTQPALDNRLTGQGADGVFEPMVNVARSFDSSYGTSTFDVQGQGFVFFNQTAYNQGTFRFQATQDFSPKTSLVFRYYIAPDMYLGENEVRMPHGAAEEGEATALHEETGEPIELAAERVTSQIGSLRMTQALTEGLNLRLLGRFGTRRYVDKFAQRDLNLWTLGPHLEWHVAEPVKLLVGYHFERGTAQGQEQPELADDVSYNNNYASTELEIELPEELSLIAGLHYERNRWTSSIEADERYGAIETVWQGEALLIYRMTENSKLYGGVQHSRRSENVSSGSIMNTNVAIGLQATF